MALRLNSLKKGNKYYLANIEIINCHIDFKEITFTLSDKNTVKCQSPLLIEEIGYLPNNSYDLMTYAKKSLRGRENYSGRTEEFLKEYGKAIVNTWLIDVLTNYSFEEQYFNEEREKGSACPFSSIEEMASSFKEEIISALLPLTDQGNVGRSEISVRPLYADRTDKSENAPEFLKRVYEQEINSGNIALSDLSSVDQKLWAGLKAWAHHGKHDLSLILPLGKPKPGRPPRVPTISPDQFIAGTPEHALAVEAERKRLMNLERVNRWRAKQPKS